MTTRDDKARFRATRERVGLSQKAVAAALGNTVDMVKKWENPKYAPPPGDAWRLLDAALSAHVRVVRDAVGRVEAMDDKLGGPPEAVTLSFFRSQHHYDQCGRDRGDYALVNARSLEIAAVLEDRGYRVRFVYPEDRSEAERAALAPAGDGEQPR